MDGKPALYFADGAYNHARATWRKGKRNMLPLLVTLAGLALPFACSAGGGSSSTKEDPTKGETIPPESIYSMSSQPGLEHLKQGPGELHSFALRILADRFRSGASNVI